ncbi:MAG: cytochrome P450, partial [Gemmatimonadaceae bacterium]
RCSHPARAHTVDARAMSIVGERSRRFPLGAALTQEMLADDPYPLFHELRPREPVTWAGALGQWLVTRRDDVMAVVRDPETFRTDSPSSPIRDTFGAQMLSTEGEQQRRFKSPTAAPFNARAVEQHSAPVIREIVESQLRNMRGLHGGDLRILLAAPVARSTVAHVLGIAPELEDTLGAWYETFADALVNYDARPETRARAHAAADEFRQAITPILRSPGPDESNLLSYLARQYPRVLDDEEIASTALIVLFGGIETTEAALSNALWALMMHPEALQRARTSDEALAACFEESLRWEPAVQTCTRYAASDTVLRAARIAAGETVQCMIGAANRDPAQYALPDRFDPWREDAGGHLAFGFGRHFCLGAALARVEARLTMRALLQTFPALAIDPVRAVPPRGHEFRKPPTLFAIWHA